MTRPPFYFKLNRRIIRPEESTDNYTIYGEIRRRSKYLPSWFDEVVSFHSKSYELASSYADALFALENEAFKFCEKLIEEDKQMLQMIELHEKNLRKLNLGYKLIGWFKDMSNNAL